MRGIVALILLYGILLSASNIVRYAHIGAYIGARELHDSRLALLWINARTNPLFALPNSQTDTLLAAADALALGYEEVVAGQPGLEKFVPAIPVDFLHNVAVAENRRRQFLTEPTRYNAGLYVHALESSVEAYNSALTQLIIALQDTPPNDGYVYINGSTTPAFFIESLLELRESVDAKMSRVRASYRCLNHLIVCYERKNTYRSTAITASGVANTIPEQVMRNFSLLRTFYARDTYRVTATGTTPQLVIVNNSVCSPSEPAYFIVRDTTSRMGSVPMVTMTTLNELFFNDLEAQDASMGLASELRNRGLAYSFQPINPYMCADASLDYGEVLTALTIANELRQQPIFSDLQRGRAIDTYANLAISERSITSDVSATQSASIEDYINHIRDLLETTQETALATEIGAENVMRLRDMTLLWDAKTAGYEKLIGWVADLTVTELSLQRLYPLSPERWPMIRMYPSILFMTQNATVWEPRQLTETIASVHPSLLRMVPFGLVFDDKDSAERVVSEMLRMSSIERQVMYGAQ